VTEETGIPADAVRYIFTLKISVEKDADKLFGCNRYVNTHVYRLASEAGLPKLENKSPDDIKSVQWRPVAEFVDPLKAKSPSLADHLMHMLSGDPDEWLIGINRKNELEYSFECLRSSVLTALGPVSATGF
jgi:hypothetical protein